MRTWLYLASKIRASAEVTYDLAYNWGLVWRAAHQRRSEQRPLVRRPTPNAVQIRPGDEVLLAYRLGKDRFRALGLMFAGTPEVPLQGFPAFCKAPDEIAGVLEKSGYTPDPELGVQVGIFVTNVEPCDVEFTVLDLSQNAIHHLSQLPFELPKAPSRSGPRGPERAAASEVLGMETAPKTTMTTGADAVFVGIDVGGRKGFDLALLQFSSGRPVRHRESRVGSHATLVPPTETLRSAVAQGRLGDLAKATHRAADEISQSLWNAIVKLCEAPPHGVFIDSPSAFSRNRIRHGRRTEKQRLRGVSFQSSPSIACGREHNGDWGWIVYGMIAFAACWKQGAKLTLDDWVGALTEGLSQRTLSLENLVVRECFPTATISFLRQQGRAADLEELLRPLVTRGESDPAAAVIQYLQHGVWGTKRAGVRLFDAADALVAALHGFPHVSSQFTEVHPVPPRANWEGADSDEQREGAIALME